MKSDLGAIDVHIIKRENRGAKGLRFVVLKNGEIHYLEGTANAGGERLRRPDLLERWRQSQTISPSGEVAARQFMKDYFISMLPIKYTMSSWGERVQRSLTPSELDRLDADRMKARDNLDRLYDSIGERGKDIADKVLCEDWSLKNYAQRIKANEAVAKGVLVGVIGVMAHHFGLE